MRSKTIVFILMLTVAGLGGCNASSEARCWRVKCSLDVDSSVKEQREGTTLTLQLRFASELEFTFPWFEDPLCNFELNSTRSDDSLVSSNVRCVRSDSALPSKEVQRRDASSNRRFVYTTSKKTYRTTDDSNAIELEIQGYISAYEDDTYIVSFSEDTYFTFRDETIVHTSVRIEPTSFLDSEPDGAYAYPYLMARVEETENGRKKFRFVPVTFDEEGKPVTDLHPKKEAIARETVPVS